MTSNLDTNAGTVLEVVGENVWMLGYPLNLLGLDMRRNVTVIRLASGKLVIHSTGPFTPADVAAIKELGDPGWIVEGILRHDTFAKEGRAAFPDIPYLAPEGFSKNVPFETGVIPPAPPEWAGELKVVELAGQPSAREIAMVHVPSRTLIITELLFNFGDHEPIWSELLLRVAVGAEHHPGLSRGVKLGIKDEEAFRTSLATVESWDFDRIVVGHGEVILSGGKEKLRKALAASGF